MRWGAVVLGLVAWGCAGARTPTEPPPEAPATEPKQAVIVPSPPEPGAAADAATVDPGDSPDSDPMLEIVGATTTPADKRVLVCTGGAPTPGTPLRSVNLCDLLAEDAKRDDAVQYELVSARYADIRPTWASGEASLCAGEEALLTVRKIRAGSEARECLQFRCVSSFPPAPTRIGKNGEFCRSAAGTFEGWLLRPGRVEARYNYAVDAWNLTAIGEQYESLRR
jgi:hypothetical protein